MDRNTAYNLKRGDKRFAAAYKAAMEEACDALEREARRRAYEGLIRKKFDKGRPVIDPATNEQYVEYEYSDTLMIFLLKAHRPKKFRDNVKHEHTGPKGGPITVVEVSRPEASDAAEPDRS